MIRSFALATCLLAAGAGIVACSSSSTPMVPGGSRTAAQAAQAVRPSLHLEAVGIAPDASCPSGYFLCVTVSKSHPAKASICVRVSSVCAPGTWTWTAQVQTLKGKPFKNLIEKINPNPGNPIEDTIREKIPLQPSHGAPKYQQAISACDTSTDCIYGTIGIITK